MWPFSKTNDVSPKLAIPYIKRDIRSEPAVHVVKFSHDDSPVQKNWFFDLNIFYLFDRGNSFTYINNITIERNGITPDQLHEIAINNINKLKYEIKEFDSVFGVFAGGNFESSVVFNDSFNEYINKRFDGMVVAAMPTRDVFAFCPMISDKGICELKKMINKLSGSGDHSITDRLIECDKGKWKYYDV